MVCDAIEISANFEYIFQGVPHHFCSERCQRRFKEYPHLYVGCPQYGLSIKQQGKTVVKRRVISLESCLSHTGQEQLSKHLDELRGVNEYCCNGRKIEVVYDLICISLKDIELVVESVAGALKESVVATSKRHAIHFGEKCELDNLAHLSDSGKQYSF